ncbi:GntR family transcriptional regulator [Conexibacter sp. JD483]|uniref:FadR/GntR family transcriptional regulator n=1 Tax=unclassified Conexibacter TaxID=2627773 RepID=UPI002718AE20|nr:MULTISPECIES: GntR family transcriptional regulator [unclassified Conexibacter]MDO8185060.1 GntR family transcriptional regulator [Conexibacter sp. CPCC 205706]MDO8196770.1 GntR family transcriptional regulator [Conexibacter sp. CPCC 205762]MDR9368018.1 GntR family transcriptional regulator [Conexibacter sp. JD483]
MSFRAVTRNPAYEQVAQQLREAILDGQLRPGDELPSERELCAQFGVSRTTVREALRALQTQGLAVQAGPTAPLRVPQPDALSTGPLRDSLVHLMKLGRVPLSDLVELRCALEAAAVATAANTLGLAPLNDPARQRAAAHVADARAALDTMRRQLADTPPAAAGSDADPALAPAAPAVADVAAFEQADVAFHVALVAASGNEALQLVMLAVRDSISTHLRDALTGDHASQRTLNRLARQHEAILAAVEAGDARDAELLLRDHVIGFYRGTTRR